MVNDNRIIHYCWFGPKKIPDRLQKCICTWSYFMPEWELRLWNEDNFDVSSLPWTKAAYEAGKYAFVSDVVRLKALYDHGGIYLDTDVKLCKSLEPLVRKYGSFMGFENCNVLTSSVISATKGHPLVLEFLEYYRDIEFSESIISSNQANVHMITDVCKRYGLITKDMEQDLHIPYRESIVPFHIFPRTYFCPLDFYHNKYFSDLTHSIHFFDASWLDNDVKSMIKRERKPIHKAIIDFKMRIGKLFNRILI